MAANIRCFVAMAFDRPDTDAIFVVIKRALKPLGIVPRRVDRIEHNDNIDAKIISELEEADLVIADLTYARPSVYFEAGYAQREIPVIYTARRDHFREKDDDPHGNFYVHFDLKMRNIISWSSQNDPAFEQRLRARVVTVIRPLLRKQTDVRSQNEAIAAFDSLSLGVKTERLFDVAFEHFKNLDYRMKDLHVRDHRPPNVRDALRRGTFLAIKQNGPRIHIVFFSSIPTLTTKICDAYYGWLDFPSYKPEMLDDPKTPPTEITEDFVICSLGSGGLNRLRKSIPELHTGDLENTLAYKESSPFVRFGPGTTEVMRHCTLHLIESPRRLVQLQQILKDRFPPRASPSVAPSSSPC
jgi:hypothetical protein